MPGLPAPFAAATRCAPCGPMTRTARQAPVAVPRRKAKILRIVEASLFMMDSRDCCESAPSPCATSTQWLFGRIKACRPGAIRPSGGLNALIHQKQQHFLRQRKAFAEFLSGAILAMGRVGLPW